MDIVVAGAGKIGEKLCRDLSSGGYNVTLIEQDPDRLEQMINNCDITGVEGSGSLYSVQEEASVEGCDVFIAVTPDDETNIIACITARTLGARYCVSRVRSPEYSMQMLFMRESLGIDMLVNPDLEAARHIDRNLGFPSALNLEHFGHGRVNIATYPLPAGSPLAGRSLIDLATLLKSVNICAIERNDEVFIPFGQTVIEEGDHLMITGTTQHLNEFYVEMGGAHQRMSNVLIIGAGRITHYLLPRLARQHIRAKVIETRAAAAEELAAAYPDVEVVRGDGTDQQFLREERVSHFDAVIALTGIDEENILVSIYAARMGVPKTVTKVNRTTLLDVLDDVGLQAIVTPFELASDQVIRFIRSIENIHGSNIEAFYRIADQRVEALQFVVEQDARICGVPLMDLPIRKNVLVAAIVRGEEVLFPGGADRIQTGDHVIITTSHTGFKDIDDILETRR